MPYKYLLEKLQVSQLKTLCREYSKLNKDFQAELKGYSKLTKRALIDLLSSTIPKAKELAQGWQEVHVKNDVLDFRGRAIENIPEIIGLDQLVSIQRIFFDSNQIREIKGLENLKHVWQLSFSNNRIEEISGLGELINLRELFLDGNQIREVKGLENLRHLSTLYLANNLIEEMEGLKNLGLVYIDLSNNRITEMKQLADFKFTRSSQINLAGNHIPQEELKQFLRILRSRGVYYEFVRPDCGRPYFKYSLGIPRQHGSSWEPPTISIDITIHLDGNPLVLEDLDVDEEEVEDEHIKAQIQDAKKRLLANKNAFFDWVREAVWKDLKDDPITIKFTIDEDDYDFMVDAEETYLIEIVPSFIVFEITFSLESEIECRWVTEVMDTYYVYSLYVQFNDSLRGDVLSEFENGDTDEDDKYIEFTEQDWERADVIQFIDNGIQQFVNNLVEKMEKEKQT